MSLLQISQDQDFKILADGIFTPVTSHWYYYFNIPKPYRLQRAQTWLLSTASSIYLITLINAEVIPWE